MKGHILAVVAILILQSVFTQVVVHLHAILLAKHHLLVVIHTIHSASHHSRPHSEDVLLLLLAQPRLLLLQIIIESMNYQTTEAYLSVSYILHCRASWWGFALVCEEYIPKEAEPF